jgi:hypothetical protein
MMVYISIVIICAYICVYIQLRTGNAPVAVHMLRGALRMLVTSTTSSSSSSSSGGNIGDIGSSDIGSKEFRDQLMRCGDTSVLNELGVACMEMNK